MSEKIESATTAVELLNNQLEASEEERDTSLVELCMSSLGSLNPKYKVNEEKTKIEKCVFDCGACQSVVSIEFSDPIFAVALPDECRAAPAPGEITVTEL